MGDERGVGARRQELADFLRSRRAQLSPRDLGLSGAGRRRTPGLRREEIAELSGVSLTWYTWLEQARHINVSDQVLLALARTLQLDDAETDHLLRLGTPVAGGSRRRVSGSPPRDATAAPAALTRLLAAIDPNPAYAISPRWDIVAWNDSYETLYGGISELAPTERNLLWLVFTSPSVRSLLGDDWATEARRLLSQFRAEAADRLDEPAFGELIARLQASSESFRDWWARHDVAFFESRQRRFEHPTAGTVRLDHHKLIPADHPELRVIVYTPADDGPDHDARRTAPRGDG